MKATMCVGLIGIVAASGIFLCFRREKERPNQIPLLLSYAEGGKPISQISQFDSMQLSAEEIDEAIAFICFDPSCISYHLLLAVRNSSPAAYVKIAKGTRAKILTSARDVHFQLDDWGYLSPDDCVDATAAKALLECGGNAVPFLARQLKNDSPARFSGTHIPTMVHEFQVRRKDFAFRYLSLLLNQKPAFDPDPLVRDKRIEELSALVPLKKAD